MNANDEPQRGGTPEEQTRREALQQQEIELCHANALTLRETYCTWCAHAVPQEDFSTKFAQAGGVLVGPFCSARCYWDFIRTHDFHELSRGERREYYRGETA